MKRFKFTEVDAEKLTPDRSPSLESVIDLLCATESAINSMMNQIMTMSGSMEEILRLQEQWLPDMVDELKQVKQTMKRSTKNGIQESEELRTVLREVANELRTQRSAETRVSENT